MLGFLNGAMASATQRFMSYSEGEGNKEKQKSIFNVSLVLHFGIAFIVGIVLLIAGYFFFNGILNIPVDRIFAAKVVYASLIVSTMFTVMTVPYDAAMNAHENMKYYAIVGILESLLKLAVAFACVYTTQDKLIVYGSLMACIPLITLTIMRVYCHKHYEECTIRIKQYWNKELMKEMTSFAGWNFISSLSSIISQYGLSIVLNYFWGTILNAAQGIANQISGQLMVFSNTMLKALNPVITKSRGSGNNELMLKASLQGCKYAYLMLIFFAIPFILEAPYILKMWLKNVPDWCIVFCVLQLLRSIIEQLTINMGTTISAQGQIKGYSIVRSLLGILPIILTTVFFYFKYPPYVMYIVWILCGGVIGGGFALYYVRKLCELDLSIYIKNVFFPCITVSMIMVVAGYMPHLFLNDSFYRLILTILITTTTMSIYCWYYFDNQEKELIKEVVIKLRSKIQ